LRFEYRGAPVDYVVNNGHTIRVNYGAPGSGDFLIVGNKRRANGLTVNPADFLPRDAGYYAYTGSQTAPPCKEGVKWFVLKTPIELSARQIAAFAELYPDDVRLPQPLNGRIVTESR
jgi:carbonic anhydrase